jgi:hypothetical protein
VRKKQVPVYLDPAVHEWASKRAAEEGRSLSQMIAKIMLDTAKVKPAIAPKIQWPKTDPWAPPAPQYTASQLQQFKDWNQWQAEEGIIAGDPIEVFVRQFPNGWTPPPEAEPEKVQYKPSTHEIPANWVNAYGKTLDQQNEDQEDDELEYWDPSQAPTPKTH